MDKFRDNIPLEEQVEILADFLMKHFPEEMGKSGSEGAIEMAIRLLKAPIPDDAIRS